MGHTTTATGKPIDIGAIATIIQKNIERGGLQVTAKITSRELVTINSLDPKYKIPLEFQISKDGVKGPSPQDFESDGKSLWSAVGISIVEDLSLEDLHYNQNK